MRKYLLLLAMLVSLNQLMAQSFPGTGPVELTNTNGVTQRLHILSGSGATRTLLAADTGSLVLLDRAAGIVFTLPAPATGLYFDFVVTTSVTTNAYKFSTATQGTDFFRGPLISDDTDTSDALVGFPCNGTTHDNISMNGSTTGGLVGTHVRVIGISTTVWQVQGVINGNSTVATSCATS